MKYHRVLIAIAPLPAREPVDAKKQEPIERHSVPVQPRFGRRRPYGPGGMAQLVSSIAPELAAAAKKRVFHAASSTQPQPDRQWKPGPFPPGTIQ